MSFSRENESEVVSPRPKFSLDWRVPALIGAFTLLATTTGCGASLGNVDVGGTLVSGVAGLANGVKDLAIWTATNEVGNMLGAFLLSGWALGRGSQEGGLVKFLDRGLVGLATIVSFRHMDAFGAIPWNKVLAGALAGPALHALSGLVGSEHAPGIISAEGLGEKLKYAGIGAWAGLGLETAQTQDPATVTSYCGATAVGAGAYMLKNTVFAR